MQPSHGMAMYPKSREAAAALLQPSKAIGTGTNCLDLTPDSVCTTPRAWQAAAAGGGPLQERCLLLQLLQGGTLQTVSHLTVQTFCLSVEALEVVPAPDSAALKQRYLGRPCPALDGASSFRRSAISRLLPAEVPESVPPRGAAASTHHPLEQQQQQQAQQQHADARAEGELLAGVVQRLTLEGFEPAWQRPRPAVLTPSFGELRWLQLPLGQELLWDSTMGEDPGGLQVVRDLVAKALKGPLLPVQQQQVLSELEADPKLVHSLGLSAEQLPALVENTPVIAYEVLLRMMPSRQIHRYLQRGTGGRIGTPSIVFQASSDPV
ncbi:hypothetical protein MNEG_11245 [Monoraphidium neglectum]|uniref:CCR4-NOT transcription complex subunit 11 n=1 Tax=Monoraphidium neglectum TaxID=145388 RepID=A0A0D2LZB2_9CHLO|nr:hypothetical protein MNEG_11245 [Monoraphidium neglectum]KIY96719.1 hypothetical protein MNEG_11245 [Monoraphidium neglectum]|eukprot:XP_013895739.1 hypothetical protein MNEG_11245 [Monoraphidium neglectum]